jgi:4-amino-4-deoxy-L-arabinose transferase-like glycosyltransferase
MPLATGYTQTAEAPFAITSPSTSNSRGHLWAAFTVALIIRLAVCCFTYSDFLVPGRSHWEFGYELGKVAFSLYSGHGFGNPYWVPTGPTAMVTPVYPFLISCAFQLFGPYTKAAALAMLSFNSLVSALTCIPVFFLARRFFGLRTAIASVWAWALFPYAINFSANSMWYHSLVAFLLATQVSIASYLEVRSKLWMWAGFGAMWGLSALTNPVVLAVVPFIGAWVCYRLRTNGHNWKLPASVGFAAMMITLAPWVIRNCRVFERPVFLKDNLWMEVCVGNLGNAAHWWNDAVHPAGSNAELSQFQQFGEYAYMVRERRQAFDFIRNHPGTLVWRSARRFVYMWTGYWSLRRDYLREEPLDLPNIFFCTIFSAIALFGLRKAFLYRLEAAIPLVLVLLTFPLVYYVTHSEISYRLPIDPILVIFASFAVCCRRGRESDFEFAEEGESRSGSRF